MSDDAKHDSGEPGWFDRKENVDKLWYGLLGVCGLLLVAEFLYEHHPHFGIDGFPEFYAIFGFVAFIAIVFAARRCAP